MKILLFVCKTHQKVYRAGEWIGVEHLIEAIAALKAGNNEVKLVDKLCEECDREMDELVKRLTDGCKNG